MGKVEAGDRALETAREIHDAAHGCGDTVEHMAALIQSAMNAQDDATETRWQSAMNAQDAG
jgi:hypothetical protein